MWGGGRGRVPGVPGSLSASRPLSDQSPPTGASSDSAPSDPAEQLAPHPQTARGPAGSLSGQCSCAGNRKEPGQSCVRAVLEGG